MKVGGLKFAAGMKQKDTSLEELRKVTALGVRAMEIHGCPEREAIVDTPPHSGKCDDKDCDCQK